MLAPDSSSCSLSLQLHYLLLKSTLVSHDQHKNAEKKNRLSIDNEEAIIYVKPEDEIFHKVYILFDIYNSIMPLLFLLIVSYHISALFMVLQLSFSCRAGYSS
jgi:hypothetical protein